MYLNEEEKHIGRLFFNENFSSAGETIFFINKFKIFTSSILERIQSDKELQHSSLYESVNIRPYYFVIEGKDIEELNSDLWDSVLLYLEIAISKMLEEEECTTSINLRILYSINQTIKELKEGKIETDAIKAKKNELLLNKEKIDLKDAVPIYIDLSKFVLDLSPNIVIDKINRLRAKLGEQIVEK